MMDPMQSHRGPTHPAGSRYGHYSSTNSGEGTDPNDRRGGDKRRDRHGHGTHMYHQQNDVSRAPSSSSISSSRWQPPKRRSTSPDIDRVRSESCERDNNSRGNGRGRGGGGGGKVNRQRRHTSNDTRNQRNQYNKQNQSQMKKKIISPDLPPANNANNNGSNNSSRQNQPATADAVPNNTNADTPKLDPNDPTHARRIHQRRRQVLFGKNTAGYEEYTKKIPKHKRRPRSDTCPMTPDHTLDVPAKRWQGLMNAWRRSLHKYDPDDLHLRQPSQDKITLAPRPCMTEEDEANEEIARAKAAGLQVAFGGMNVGRMAGMFSVGVAAEDDGDLMGLTQHCDNAAGGDGTATVNVGGGKSEEVQFDEEAAYRQTMMGGAEDEQKTGDGFLEESDSDSDDDLL